MQENREERELELFSEAVKVMMETPAPIKMKHSGVAENAHAVAFGTYLGITLSKLSTRKFCKATKCIGDILYNTEEGEDESSTGTPTTFNSFGRYSPAQSQCSLESLNSGYPMQSYTQSFY